MAIRNRQDVRVVPGDGIGEEVTAQSVRVLGWFEKHRGLDCQFTHEPKFGAAYWHKSGEFYRPGLVEDLIACDAVLFGAVGGAGDDLHMPQDIRRQFGLPSVRKAMGVFANLRPIRPIPALAADSPVRTEITDGVDMMIVRELVGGIYFGQPRGIETLPDGQRRGFNTQTYTTSEVVRIARVAFDLARQRSGRVTSVDKANVMEAGQFWREEVQALHDKEYPDVALNHLYVDNCSMQIIINPRQFDVLLTDNIFGDILSDCASVLTGSLGMLPSASLGVHEESGKKTALYEPAHGSAPDIAGQNKANPLASILSASLLLRYSLDRAADSDLLDKAVADVLARNERTADIRAEGVTPISTSGMGDAVLAALDRLAT
jgi:3-isopropylmalate dehydrogenase